MPRLLLPLEIFLHLITQQYCAPHITHVIIVDFESKPNFVQRGCYWISSLTRADTIFSCKSDSTFKNVRYSSYLVSLSVCPQISSTAWNHHLSSLILHFLHSSFLHFATFKIFSLFCRYWYTYIFFLTCFPLDDPMVLR